MTATATEPAIRLRGVTKEFGSGDAKVTALRDVDLAVPYGELVLVVGPSGCGKTTLISIVAGLLDATAGEVEVLGRNLTHMRGGRKVHFRGENIGFVFQQYNLLPALTAAENASVPLLIAGWDRRKAVKKASELLDAVGLGGRLKAYPNELSGGQQQRVAIARALVHGPRLLVCDEPTAALDAASGRTVMGLIRQVAVQPDRAVIVVTHDSRVYDFGDRIVTMSDGRIESVRTKDGGETDGEPGQEESLMLTRYALPAVAVVAFAFAVLQMTKAQHRPPPVSPPVEPARAPYPNAVSGAGLVEPETENISVGSNLPGVVKAVHVHVGQEVKPGEMLFELDDRQLLAEQQVRKAALASAKASYQKLLDMPRAEELPPLRAKVAEAKAGLEDKVKQYARSKRAGTEGGVSDEELIGRQMAVEVGKAKVAKAEADLRLAEAGAWQADKLVAAAAVAQSEAQLGQTATELDRLKVTAPWVKQPEGGSGPVTFRVLQLNVRPGEYVAATPGTALVALGTVGRLHVRVDIDENDIPRFRPGIPGVASPRGNPRATFPLRFVRVEPFVIPKKSLTGGNTERVDTRVLQVIYAIDAPNPGLYVGQQMDVSLNAGQ